MHLWLVSQPAGVPPSRVRQPRRCVSSQSRYPCLMDERIPVCLILGTAAEQALQCKQRHLRIVRDDQFAVDAIRES